ncbi:MAG: hypothetical protein LBM96_13190 [Methanobrevibacter sp.]|nr:hypothetical protein [Candidatus Methanoflexus mossambicus]
MKQESKKVLTVYTGLSFKTEIKKLNKQYNEKHNLNLSLSAFMKKLLKIGIKEINKELEK